MLKAGDVAPSFELPSDKGGKVRLTDFTGRRVVLYFYPKADTPGCTKQACALRDIHPDIEEKEHKLGVSPLSTAGLPGPTRTSEGREIAAQVPSATRWPRVPRRRQDRSSRGRMYIGIHGKA